MRIKYIVLGIVITIISFIINCIPILHSNIFTFTTILSTITIYIISRKSPSIGLLSYIASFLLISLIDSYQSIIFLFINGLLGIFLGMLRYYTENNKLVAILNGIILTISVNGMYSILGENSLYIQNTNSILTQILICAFSLGYSLIMLLFCNYIYDKLEEIN